MDIYSAANKMKTEGKNIFDLDIRVTFYARVSTTREEQENSIDNQINCFFRANSSTFIVPSRLHFSSPSI